VSARRCAAPARKHSPCGASGWAVLLLRAPPRRLPKPQCLRRSARGPAAQRISAFSTGLTQHESMAKVGGCANGLRIACGAGPLGGRRHPSLVTPIDWKRGHHTRGAGTGDGHHSLVTSIDWKRPQRLIRCGRGCWLSHSLVTAVDDQLCQAIQRSRSRNLRKKRSAAQPSGGSRLRSPVHRSPWQGL